MSGGQQGIYSQGVAHAMTKIAIEILLVIATQFCGCYTQIALHNNPDVYEGTLTFGFEVSSFRPCDSDERWWMSGSSEVCERLVTEYYANAHKPYEAAFARLRGKPSAKGQYGHLGGYDRIFCVQEVVFVRSKLLGDCRSR